MFWGHSGARKSFRIWVFHFKRLCRWMDLQAENKTMKNSNPFDIFKLTIFFIVIHRNCSFLKYYMNQLRIRHLTKISILSQDNINHFCKEFFIADYGIVLTLRKSSDWELSYFQLKVSWMKSSDVIPVRPRKYQTLNKSWDMIVTNNQNCIKWKLEVSRKGLSTTWPNSFRLRYITGRKTPQLNIYFHSYFN